MNVLSFDVESNGLYGEGFAVAGVLLNELGEPAGEGAGEPVAFRAPDPDPCDPWVREHVLPALATLPVNCADPAEVRRSFFAWYLAHRTGAHIVVDCGWPVEASFLLAAVRDVPALARSMPYPLLDVGSLFVAQGHAFDTDGEAFLFAQPPASDEEMTRCEDLRCIQTLEDYRGVAHDPRHDALVSGLCAVTLLRRIRCGK